MFSRSLHTHNYSCIYTQTQGGNNYTYLFLYVDWKKSSFSYLHIASVTVIIPLGKELDQGLAKRQLLYVPDQKGHSHILCSFLQLFAYSFSQSPKERSTKVSLQGSYRSAPFLHKQAYSVSFALSHSTKVSFLHRDALKSS